MALCLQIVSNNLRVMTTQPTDLTTCTMVVVSGAEYQLMATGSPWRMTVAEGTAVGTAIATLWVTVGVIKYVGHRLGWF